MDLPASIAVEEMHEGCDFGHPPPSPGHSTPTTVLLSDAVDSDVQSSDIAVAPKRQEPSSFTRILDPPNASASRRTRRLTRRARMSRRTAVFQAPPSSSSNEDFEVDAMVNKVQPEDNKGHEIVPDPCSAQPGSAIELCRLTDDAK